MEIEEEYSTRPNYSHYQKFIGQMLLLLPQKVKTSAENSQNRLLKAIRKLNSLIEKDPFYAKIEEYHTNKENYRPIFKMIIQCLYLSYNLQANFKIDLATEEIETSLIHGFKALSTLNLDLNFGNRLTKILEKFQFYFMPLERLTQFAKSEGLWKKFYNFLKFDYHNENITQVGKLKINPLKSSLSSLLTSCSKIFKHDFSEIYSRMMVDRVNFFDLNTGQLVNTGIDMYSFIDVSSLNHEDLYIIMKDFNFATKIIRRDSKLVVKLKEDMIDLIKASIFNVSSNIKRQSRKSDLAYYRRCIGKIFSNFLLNRNNTLEDIKIAVRLIEETVDCYVDSFHPKEKGNDGDKLVRGAISDFVQYYHRKIFAVKDFEKKKLIEKFFESLMKRCLNFGVFRRDWKNMHRMIQTLNALDPKTYCKIVLERIRLGLNQDEFEKFSLYNFMYNSIKPICEIEELTENLYWIIPNMLQRLEDTSSSEEIRIISENMNNIFEYFIAVDDSVVSKDFPHLERYKDDIDESALRMFSFILKKGKDFNFTSEQIKMILSQGKFVGNKILDRFSNDFVSMYNSFNETNLQMIITGLMNFNSEKIQEIILNWMNTKVWKKVKNGTKTSDLKLGKVLEYFGIKEVEYELRSNNEAIIKREISVISSISRKTLMLSQESFLATLKYFALCINHEISGVVSVAINANNLYMHNLTFNITGYTHRSFLRKAIREDSDNFRFINFNFPEEDDYDRVKDIFSGITLSLFETVEDYMKKILRVDTIEEISEEEHVVDIYKDTIKQEGQDENLDHLNNPLIEDLCDVVKALNGLISQNYFYNHLFKSKKLASYIRSFKMKMVSFLKKSKLFELDKVKSSLLFFLTYEAFTVEKFIDVNRSLNSNVTQTFSFCSGNLFKELPVRKQFTCAYYFGKNLLRIEKLLNGSENLEGIPLFDSICSENSYLKNLQIQDFELTTNKETNFFFFSDLIHDYIIQDSVIKSFYQISPLALKHNSNLDHYKFLDSLLHTGPYYLQDNITERTFNICIELLNLNCSVSTDYNDIVNTVTYQMINYFTQPIETLEMKEKYLEILSIIAEKADSNKCFTQFKKDVVLLADMAPEFEISEKTKEVFIQKIESVNKFLNEKSAISFFVLAIDILSEISHYKDDSEIIKKCVLAFSSRLDIKDIRKRILLSVLLIYTQSILEEKHLSKEELIVSCESLSDENGIIGVETTREIIKEIKFKLGFRESGSENIQVAQEFANLTPEFLPIDTGVYGRPPFKFTKYTYSGENGYEFNEEQTEKISEIYTEYLKGLIEESENMDSNDYKSLSINQSFIHEILKFKENVKMGLKDSTLMFKKVTSALLINFGPKIYESVKGIFKELKAQSQDNISSIRRFEQEFYSVSLNTASNYYNNEHFEKIAEETVEVFKNYMNPLYRNLQMKGMLRFSLAIQETTNSKRILKILEFLNNAYKKVSEPESKCMMLTLYDAVLTASNILFDSETQETLKNGIEITTLNTLKAYSEIGSLLIVLQQSSLATSYSIEKVKQRAKNIKIEDFHAESVKNNIILYAEISRNEGFDPLKLSIEFLKKSEHQTVLTRLSVLKTFLVAVLRTSKFYVNEETMELGLLLLKLAISLDSQESEEAKLLVSGAKVYIQFVFTGFIIEDSLREQFFKNLEGIYSELKNVTEKKELFVKCYSIICETCLNEARVDFLATILGGFNTQTSEKISEDLLYSIERTSQGQMLKLTKHILQRMDDTEKTKENMELLTGYGVLLINFIVAKNRERGPIVDEAFRGVIKYRKDVKLLKNRFNRFLSDFWKKKKMNIELSAYELADDIKDVVDQYQMPYSYFS